MKTIVLKPIQVEHVSFDDQRITLVGEGMSVQLHLNKDAVHVKNLDQIKDTEIYLTIGSYKSEQDDLKIHWEKIKNFGKKINQILKSHENNTDTNA